MLSHRSKHSPVPYFIPSPDTLVPEKVPTRASAQVPNALPTNMTSHSHFLALPLELRTRIYSLYFGYPLVILWERYHHRSLAPSRSDSTTTPNNGDPPEPSEPDTIFTTHSTSALLCTCRQIHAEAHDIRWAQTVHQIRCRSTRAVYDCNDVYMRRPVFWRLTETLSFLPTHPIYAFTHEVQIVDFLDRFQNLKRLEWVAGRIESISQTTPDHLHGGLLDDQAECLLASIRGDISGPRTQGSANGPQMVRLAKLHAWASERGLDVYVTVITVLIVCVPRRRRPLISPEKPVKQCAVSLSIPVRRGIGFEIFKGNFADRRATMSRSLPSESVMSVWFRDGLLRFARSMEEGMDIKPSLRRSDSRSILYVFGRS